MGASFLVTIAATTRASLSLIRTRRTQSASCVCLFSTKSATNAHALAFSVSPNEAVQKFHRWAEKEQGLSFPLQPRDVGIGASYCPVWSFDMNIRFLLINSSTGRKTLGWKPSALAAAYSPQQSVVYLPGLSAYAGYTYRRSLVNPVHSTSLVFLADETVPFGAWMLKDMTYNGHSLPVYGDAWNATKGRAFSVVRSDLAALAAQECLPEGNDAVEVQTQVVNSRRVYMPTYVVTYKILGVEYQAVVSGCDAGSAVSGESHIVFSTSTIDDNSYSWFGRLFAATQRGFQIMGLRGLLIAVQVLGGILSRFLIRLPAVGLVAGAFIGVRKVLQPFYHKYKGGVEWERQRENEAYETIELRLDDFADSGAAQRYFQNNRGKILSQLSGEDAHQQGTYDWYKDWEEWARRQWQQQQDQAFSSQQHQSSNAQSSSRSSYRARVPPEYKWSFDVNDPYSILGIKRGASKAEVSAAFRREMLKYHPDMQARNTESERMRASERAKLVNEAYRKIKKDLK